MYTKTIETFILIICMCKFLVPKCRDNQKYGFSICSEKLSRKALHKSINGFYELLLISFDTLTIYKIMKLLLWLY